MLLKVSPFYAVDFLMYLAIKKFASVLLRTMAVNTVTVVADRLAIYAIKRLV